MLGAAILALLAGIWGGWIRIGWQWPVLQPSLVGAHGPLMISGFFGTLISVERAVALGKRWPYIGPILSGLGGVLLAFGWLGSIPALLMTASSFWLVLIFGAILRRHLARYTLVMASGALAWAVGNTVWVAGRPISQVVLWWAAFLILTIAGERLELGRLIRYPRGVGHLFLALTGLFLAGLLVASFLPNPGTRLASTGLIGLAAWLLRFDIARKTIRQAGLPRFAAICLLSGYAWLAVAGGIGLWFGFVPAGSLYDAFIHAIFLGFVFAMIFAHAPIIFPAILMLPIKFERSFYLPLLLLHFSLLLRITGDLFIVPQLRLWGGLLNGITILIFLLLTGRSVLGGVREKRSQTSRASESPPASDAADLRMQAAWLSRVWKLAFIAFLIAGLTGSLMRYWMATGFPAAIQFFNVRHAHSHLMYFAWVTPALMSLIAARLPIFTGRPVPRAMLWSIGATFSVGLLSYAPFFFWGYEPAIFFGRRLPLAMILATLNILAWYAFALSFRKTTRNINQNRPVRLWNAALLFLLAASLGAWGRAVLAALKIEDAFLSTAAIHLFLDLFSNGWAVLGLLGLAYAAKPQLAKQLSGWEDPLLFLGLPLSFLLGMPVDLVPVDLRTLAGIGGLMVASGLGLHVRKLWPAFKEESWNGWRAPLIFLLIVAGMDAAASLAPLARWGETLGLRILYLHILLLGFVTLGLVTAGLELWDRQARGSLRWMGWSVSALLVSLLPLTGLWPELLSGSWRLWTAVLFSLGPVIVGTFLAARIYTPGAKSLPGETSHPSVHFQGRGP